MGLRPSMATPTRFVQRHRFTRCINQLPAKEIWPWPRSPENCHFVIEAKRLGTGLEGALGQARSYVAELGVERDVIVTDGLRYRLYDAASDFSPVAYANVRRLKRSALQLLSRLRSP